jgi:SnoaL-like domain
MADLTSEARGAVEAFNNADWDGARKYFADSTYTEFGTQRSVSGFDALLELMQGWKAAMPDVRGTVTGAAEEGQRVVLEIWAHRSERRPSALVRMHAPVGHLVIERTHGYQQLRSPPDPARPRGTAQLFLGQQPQVSFRPFAAHLLCVPRPSLRITERVGLHGPPRAGSADLAHAWSAG